jgi:Uma2 family endonuclease
MTTTQTGTKLTYEEYLVTPETMIRCEVVDGEVIVAGPNLYHQIVSGNINDPLRAFVRGNQLGRVVFAPVDVVVRRDPLRVRQPDLLFVSNERANILGDRIEGGPDLVVEIISPSNTRAEIESRLVDYASINVRECWLVYPQIHAAEVLQLEGGEWRRAYIRGAGERIESAVLPGLELDIAAIFEGA